jgi:hypothetical protein
LGADITYVPTAAGFLYLAVVLDVWSRKIVGWSMANHLRTELVLDALEMAVGQRRSRDVIHHSDSKSIPATDKQRQAFRATLAIPGNFRIWIGRCGVDGWQTAYWRHASTFSTSPDIKPEHPFKNTHSVTFGIGELLVTALTYHG